MQRNKEQKYEHSHYRSKLWIRERYMGDDLPDLPALKMVGLACCPSDAVTEVREVCSWISSNQGGQGAVRELTDFLIKAKRP